MRKNRNPELRREDCNTEEQKIAYSRMMYERWESDVGEMPSAILDFEMFPLEREPWHSPEYWIMRAKAEREKRRLLSGK